MRVVAREVLAVDVAGEGRPGHVLAVVLDGDVVLARGHGRVGDLVAVLHLVAGEVDLGGSVDGDGEGAGAHAGGVDDEGRPLA